MQPALFPSGEATEPVPDEDVVAILAAAIRDAKGGRMTREAEIFMASLCAEHLVDRLALAGVTVVRRGEGVRGEGGG